MDIIKCTLTLTKYIDDTFYITNIVNYTQNEHVCQ